MRLSWFLNCQTESGFLFFQALGFHEESSTGDKIPDKKNSMTPDTPTQDGPGNARINYPA